MLLLALVIVFNIQAALFSSMDLRFLLFAGVLLLLSGCTQGNVPPAGSATPTAVITVTISATPFPSNSSFNSTLGVRTKTSGCVIVNYTQDRECTPGAVFSNVTTKQVCVSGYSSSVRDVPQSLKNAVYAEYGIATHQPYDFEIDHLISLELGGSNDVSNLWPESYAPKPGAREKDVVENYLHRQACDGVITLQQAQEQIASDWLSVYNKIHPANSTG